MHCSSTINSQNDEHPLAQHLQRNWKNNHFSLLNQQIIKINFVYQRIFQNLHPSTFCDI